MTEENKAYEHPGFIAALDMVELINKLDLEMYSNQLHSFNDKFGKENEH